MGYSAAMTVLSPTGARRASPLPHPKNQRDSGNANATANNSNLANARILTQTALCMKPTPIGLIRRRNRPRNPEAIRKIIDSFRKNKKIDF
jgi:hypothetical protein